MLPSSSMKDRTIRKTFSLLTKHFHHSVDYFQRKHFIFRFVFVINVYFFLTRCLILECDPESDYLLLIRSKKNNKIISPS